MPRWWPSIERVEGVQDARFTTISRSQRGRPVRIDLRFTTRTAPERIAWEQELAGTPFERILTSAVTELELVATSVGTIVSATRRQRLRGFSRLGAWIARRGARTQLEQALAGLSLVFGGD